MNTADAAHLAALRDATEAALAAAIPPGSDVAVVDAPNQINVGDSLIWAGELAYFRRLRLRIRYLCDLQGYEPETLRRLMPDGIVLIHGGGNFGDLWQGHQNHREQIVADLPDYRIVQLPQSIWFGSLERAAQANAALGAHPDFLTLARDEVSIDRAREQLPDLRTAFCHDMALGWDAPAATARPDPAGPPRVLGIARADKESSSGLAEVGPEWLDGAALEITDWGDLGLEARRWRRARRLARLEHRRVRYARRAPVLHDLAPQPVSRRALAQINRSNIRAGVALYDGASAVVVDRLHAHVIALLRGIPHVLLDNSYGKLRAVYDSTTHGFSTARYTTSLEQARAVALELLG